MDKWLGCDNIELIWHGEWSDPELRFEDHVIDIWSIEDFVVSEMKGEGLDYNSDDLYADWVRSHQELIEATIIEFSEAKND